ncbi:hypothetical protein TNCV_4013411 [Trichonephila clavipes]|nr:hypothetical protein TNCV_4013411 [Trichonephila clavipes]
MRSCPVTKHKAGRQGSVRHPSMEENILNVIAVGPESSTRAVVDPKSVSYQIVCRVLNDNRLRFFHF